MKKALIASLLLVLASMLVAASSLQVSTDKATYSPGETITITIRGKPNTTYALEVRNPDRAPVAIGEVDTGADGVGIFTFILPREARLGTYSVYVSGGGEAASTSFNVVAPTTAPPAVPSPVAPPLSAVAAAALRDARGRLQLLLYVLRSLNSSLNLLRLGGVLTEVWIAVGSVNSTLQQADAAYAAGDYSSANSLASSAYRDAGQLIASAFDSTVSALRSYANKIRGNTSDELVLSLLTIADAILGEVSPTYVDSSLRAVNYSTYILLASARLVNAVRFEAEVKELNRQIEALHKALDEAQSRLRELERNLTTLRSMNERLSAQLSETQSALAAAGGEVERLRAEGEQLRSRNAELERRVADLSSQVNVMLVLVVLAAAAGFAAGFLLRARKSK